MNEHVNPNENLSEEPPKRKSFWQILQTRIEWRHVRAALYCVIGLIVFVFLMDKVVMPLYTKHGEEHIMPDVVNMPVDEAMNLLKEQEFRPVIEKEVYSKFASAGHVISQNPLAGSVVKKGRRTYLTVSKGAKWVRMPKLVGSSERDAILKLRQIDLVPGEITYEFSSFFPKGVVSAQSVPVGDSMSVGDTVRFTISMGDIPENVKVPNLIGKSFEEARKMILKNGLVLGEVLYQLNNDLLPETVIMQSLKPDSLVDVGAQIDLILSKIQEESKDDTTTRKYR